MYKSGSTRAREPVRGHIHGLEHAQSVDAGKLVLPTERGHAGQGAARRQRANRLASAETQHHHQRGRGGISKSARFRLLDQQPGAGQQRHAQGLRAGRAQH